MKQKVSLVLSGGGARGMAHIGVIEEIEKRGYEIHSVAGTSMGALIGGIYALGKLDALKHWMFSLDKHKIFNLVDFTFSANGLVKGDKVLNAMKKFIPDTNIEDLNINYTATAVDVNKHEEVVFRQGSVYEAIRASIAIPSVFKPVFKDGAVLVDGGVMNNIPLNNIKREKGDLLVAVYVNADVPVYKPVATKKEEVEKQSVYKKKIKDFYAHLKEISPVSNNERFGYFTLLDKTFTSMSLQMANLMIEKIPPDILVKVSRDTCGTYDFYKAKEVVEAGRQQAIKYFDEYNF